MLAWKASWGTAHAAARPAEVAFGLHGEIDSVIPLGGGVNESSIVKYADGRAGVWKPATGEHADELPATIQPGTLHQREAAAYALARQLGADVVPETVVREIDGIEGSVQRFVTAQPDFEFRGRPERQSVEHMRLLDFVTGNTDRHEGNLLWASGGKATAIDNGLAFPSGRAGIEQPASTVTRYAGKGLTAATREAIDRLDLKEIAATARAYHLDDTAVRHTLYRAQLLKEHPDILAVPGRVKRFDGSYPFKDMPVSAQREFLREASLSAESKVSHDGRLAVEAAVKAGHR